MGNTACLVSTAILYITERPFFVDLFCRLPPTAIWQIAELQASFTVTRAHLRLLYFSVSLPSMKSYNCYGFDSIS